MPGRIRLPGRAPARHVDGAMNKTEARYAAHLNLLKAAGQVHAWWFEGLTLKLAADCRLTMDFLVQLPDGTLELHDVKQRWSNGRGTTEDAAVKMRVAADKFPFRVLSATLEKDKTWTVKEY